MKKQSSLDVRKYSFSQRTINVWNNLSTDCVHARLVVLICSRTKQTSIYGRLHLVYGQGTLIITI